MAAQRVPSDGKPGEKRKTKKTTGKVRATPIGNNLGKEQVGDQLGKNRPGRLKRTATRMKGSTGSGMKAGMRQRRIRNVRSA